MNNRTKKRYALELAYNGTAFHGWQRQPNAVSVQETIEKALSLKLRENISIIGAGRTDTGVHASFFVAHFDTFAKFEAEKIIYGLNFLIGKHIVVYRIFEVASDFHARFDAISRTYEYRISLQKNPFALDTCLVWNKPLDVEKMNEACQILLKYKDFTSFARLHSDTKTNDCDLMLCHWEQKGSHLTLTIKANRFLRNMVRAIVGTLLEVGQNKINLDAFEQIILAKNRCQAGTSAPAQGLFLTDIEYHSEHF